MSKRIIVLGGDGFCGWPTALRLSAAGYDVTIVDNLSRRQIDTQIGCESLTPISHIDDRLTAWEWDTGNYIGFVLLDIADHYHRLLSLINELEPVAIVHFAEQRAAPYSMKSAYHKRYTVNNNINGTHNVLCAIVESGLDIHLIHLGSMGVYGYGTAGMEVPEGYLTVEVNSTQIEIPYPSNPGSVYHMTKVQDALMFSYYNKNDGVRVTDLHQGIVWGVNTAETLLSETLINRFDYDGDYGTVLNRFLIQAAVGHPLTVYGTGGQTRAFIHISDTVRCIQLALENPPSIGERVQIYNQATETHTVRDLAKIVANLTCAEIRYYVNPRNEDAENDLTILNEKFLRLGLNPTTLGESLLMDVYTVAERYLDRCNMSRIVCTSTWKSDMALDLIGKDKPSD
jgi:UDP-sulfoquinovose synthase